MVLAAGEGKDEASREALEQLCSNYWQPLYCFARRRGNDLESARDLTQGFLTQLIEKKSIRAASPERGRFRTFLLSSFKNYLTNEWEKRTAQKRGGARPVLSLDSEEGEKYLRATLKTDETPDELFDRNWARALLDRALGRLSEEMCKGGEEQRSRFQILVGYLTGAGLDPYSEVAQRLGMSEGAVKVAIHRMRHRFGFLLRQEVAHTVAAEDEIEAEIQHLIAIFSTG